ncbi:hypothetical protein [Rickettsiella grylli]|uniref:Uncharacterized protein n=1 Tax=Rickettsiella grylli TaxID=59196 RepID=A8PLJ5_9COXI|nr:hypothetical protein [Rickettsiella grylli]EDP46156.1 hypothetical protein RICGR_0446 [Rickettsiella grylli]
MKNDKISNEKKQDNIKIVYASKDEVKRATKKCLKKYSDVFKELAKR